MRFVKAHGTGNDFVVLPDWDDEIGLQPPLVRALCERDTGLGGDGVLRIVAPEDASGADASMDYRNADGSVAEMCGNGIRVVAKHVVDHGLVSPEGGRLRIDTRAGVKPVTVSFGDDGRVATVTVDMGPPELSAKRVPFDTDRERAIGEKVEVAGGTVQLTAVSMGNPHAVVLVDDVDETAVAELGSALETHGRFPERTNVEFVQLTDAGRARVRVWERGVGETAACGSGACAVLVALRELGEEDGPVTLAFPGGDLEVTYEPDAAASVHLTGPAVEVAAGELDPGWLASVRDAS